MADAVLGLNGVATGGEQLSGLLFDPVPVVGMDAVEPPGTGWVSIGGRDTGQRSQFAKAAYRVRFEVPIIDDSLEGSRCQPEAFLAFTKGLLQLTMVMNVGQGADPLFD